METFARPQLTDPVISEIADYVFKAPTFSEEAYKTARLCLADSLGCAMLALNYPACDKLLGPVVPGTIVPNGSRVPGTHFILDPIRAAFNLGTMIRWLDFNDTWLAAEWGHPSDNLGSILPASEYINSQVPFTMREVLTAMIQAYEIQGVLALGNSFNRAGFDHVILVKIASAAACARLLGCDRTQIENAVSNAFADAGPLRLYRHAPNTGSRKSWAAGDATSRGLQFAWMAKQGEMGYPLALSAKRWGVNDVIFDGAPVTLSRPFGSYVMENILFKISYPAEFHAQTAVEAALQLHPQLIDRLEQIKSIYIATHESAMRIIDKTGPLTNPADRDHCLQYMVAVPLIYGTLTADHYENEIAQNPLIDALRAKMVITENPQFSKDYLDPNKRSIANAITVMLKDGTVVGPVIVEYPLGHKRRREESIPFLFDKLEENLSSRFQYEQVQKIETMLRSRLDDLPVHKFVDYFISGFIQ